MPSSMLGIDERLTHDMRYILIFIHRMLTHLKFVCDLYVIQKCKLIVITFL